MTTNVLLSSTIKSNPDPRAILVCSLLFLAAVGLRCHPRGSSHPRALSSCRSGGWLTSSGQPPLWRFCRGAQALRHVGLVAVANGLCFLHSMWDLPREGIEPTAPALAGICLTTEHQESPPGSVLLPPTSAISSLVGGPPG